MQAFSVVTLLHFVFLFSLMKCQYFIQWYIFIVIHWLGHIKSIWNYFTSAILSMFQLPVRIDVV